MLARFLKGKVEGAYSFLRIVAGLMFAFHGVQGIFGVLASAPRPPVGSQLWLGSLIQLATGFLIAAGFCTTWAAFLASGTMAVAYLQFHWKFQFNPWFFPTLNKGELALLYSVLFLFVACRGDGKWSIGRLLGTKP